MVEYPCCQWNAQAIVEERPKQILLDIANGSFAQLNGRYYVEQIIFHQYYIGTIQRYVGTGADG